MQKQLLKQIYPETELQQELDKQLIEYRDEKTQSRIKNFLKHLPLQETVMKSSSKIIQDLVQIAYNICIVSQDTDYGGTLKLEALDECDNAIKLAVIRYTCANDKYGYIRHEAIAYAKRNELELNLNTCSAIA